MPEASKTPEINRFGPFELWPETGELYKYGVRLRLAGQPIDVLTRLVRTPGELVTREELQRLLWGEDDVNIDFEKGLNAAVNRLRDYLGDSATEPNYIETIPGRGYRFIAPIRFLSDINETGVAADVRPLVPDEPKLTLTHPPLQVRGPSETVNGTSLDFGATISANLRTTRYDTVPPLPQNFVPRPVELEALRQTILSDRDSRHVALVALREMGGIGKTVLAQALCRDDTIQTAFPDGVVWVKIGEKPTDADLVNQMREAARVLGDSAEGFDTLGRSSNLLRSLLKNKTALLVLDDVWEPAPIYHFQPSDDSHFCRLLFTTRNDEIAATVGARSQPLDILDDCQSRHLLATYADKSDSDLPPEADGILRECHGLPLALAMIGALLRNKSQQRWADVLHSLRNEDLGEIKLKFPNYTYPSLVAAIETSFNNLEEDEKQCYLDFAVFPEDTAVSEAALGMAWELDSRKVRRCREHLVSLSLATRDDLGRIALHDLQLDYVRKRVGNELPKLHGRLLERYKQRCSDGWHTGPNDGYFFEHLSYHLSEAGRLQELRELLLDYRWLEKKLQCSGVAALLSDFDAARGNRGSMADETFLGRPLGIPPWRIVDLGDMKSDHTGMAHEHDSNELLKLIQSALILSAHVLSKDPSQLAGQLWGRLSAGMSEEIAVLLRNARRSDHARILPLRATLTPPGGPLVRMLTGHTGYVNGVALTPDGKFVVSASGDQTLRLWNFASGREIRTLVGHSSDVYAVAVTPDGKFAVSASEDRTLKVWLLASGRVTSTLSGHSSSITGVAVTPDGRLAVSACWDRTLKIWDIENGCELRTLIGHSHWVSAVAVTPDGKSAVSASADKTLKVWDLCSGQKLRTLVGHTQVVTAVAVTPDGKFAVSASADATLKVWELDSGQELRTLSGHSKVVTAVAVTPDGNSAVSSSFDQTLKVWDLATGRELRTLTGNPHWISAVAITPNGREAVSASHDQTLKVWLLDSGPEPHVENGHSSGIAGVAVTVDRKSIVSASVDMTLKVWELASDRLLLTLIGHAGRIGAVAVTPDGRAAVSGSDDQTLKVWDLANGRELHTLSGHSSAVRAVAVAPNCQLAVSASRDQTLKVWDLASGRELHTLVGHSGGVNAVAVTPDGKLVVSASSDRTIKVWDLASGRELCSLTGHSGRITAVAITPDGRLSVSASRDHTFKVWDLVGYCEVRTLLGPSELVTAVALTPDGKLLISASTDNTLRAWSLDSGNEVATFTLDAVPTCCAMSPDGKAIVVGDAGGTIHYLSLGQMVPAAKPLLPD